MATYKQIQAYVRAHYGYSPETCWIAHTKELVGLPVRQAHNLQRIVRVKLCPPEKQEHIRKAFKHFGMTEISEDELAVVRRAEKEMPSISPYPSEFIGSLMDGEPEELYEIKAAYDEEAFIISAQLESQIPAKEKTEVDEALASVDFDLVEEWNVAPTKEFRNSISPLDKNLKGRILEAITKICQNPLKPHGDTVNPLSGELKGKWRCRIGDYRLIYQPDKNRRVIFLLAVFPRSGAYSDF